jgi:hypothetical protein
MPDSPARETWGLCRSCGEMVRLSPDPYAGESHHSPTCPERVPDGSRTATTAYYAPAEQLAPTAYYALAEQPALAEQYAPAPDEGRQAPEEPGDPAGARRPLPTGLSKKTVLGLAIAATGAILTVTLLVSGALAGKTQPTASAPHVGSRTSLHPSAFGSPSPTASPRAGTIPSPATSHRSTPLPTQTPPPTVPQPQLLVHDDFTGGSADGWVQEWGNITLTPSTQPAFDGASLVLTTSGASNVAVGTSVNGATQLTTGDTVTYHVWSSGQLAGVQPFVADDNNGIHESAVVVLPTTPGWVTVTWTVPATPSIEGIGLEVNNPSPDSGSLTVALGGVSWPQQ